MNTSTMWHLTEWEEIAGVVDGISICVPFSDEDTLQGPRNSHGRSIKVCRTYNVARFHLFDFNDVYTSHNRSTSICHMSDDEIASLRASNEWPAENGIRKKPQSHFRRNRQQLHIWMEGHDRDSNDFLEKKCKICIVTTPKLNSFQGGDYKDPFLLH